MNSSLRKTKTPSPAAHPHMIRHDFWRTSHRADMVGMAPVVCVLIPSRQRHLHLSSFIKSFPCRPTPSPHAHTTKTKTGLGLQLLSQRSLILIQLLQMGEQRTKPVLPVSCHTFFILRHGTENILHPLQHPRSHCFDSAQRNLNTRVVLSHTRQILTPFPICPTLTPPHSLTQL